MLVVDLDFGEPRRVATDQSLVCAEPFYSLPLRLWYYGSERTSGRLTGCTVVDFGEWPSTILDVVAYDDG